MRWSGPRTRSQLSRRVVETVLALLAVGVGVLIGAGDAFGQEGYRVIVNPAAGVSALTRQDIARLFLKDLTTWPNGTAAVPVDLPPGSEARERFSRDVHGRSTAAIKAYWQGQVFSGRQVPPAEEATEREVIAFVAENAGAIGYVSAAATLPAGIVVVSLSEGGSVADGNVYSSDQLEQPPERISMPPVRFPAAALRRGIEGKVTLMFVVSEAGHVETESVTVVAATSQEFAAAAKEALVQAVFRPGRIRGRAVRSRVEQAMRFALPGRP